jgi:hypothetical protein
VRKEAGTAVGQVQIDADQWPVAAPQDESVLSEIPQGKAILWNAKGAD